VGTIFPLRVLETIFGTSGVVAKTLSRRPRGGAIIASF